MLKQTIAVLCVAGALGAASIKVAHAEALIPVPLYPGSEWTEPFDINDKNVIAGAYGMPDGTAHAFFGKLGGKYKSFDGDNYDGYTQANAVDESGMIAGVYQSETLCPDYECMFVRTPDGKFYTLKKDKAPLEGYARGITDGKKFVGSYLTGAGAWISFAGQAHKYKGDYAIALNNAQARDINASGVIVGRYINDQGHNSAFIDDNGTLTTFDYPDDTEVNTTFFGINDSGQITGSWDTGSPDFVARGFVYDLDTATFRDLHVPGESAYTYMEGINDNGFIAIRSDAGSFVYCPKNHCPGGTPAALGPARHAASAPRRHAAQPATQAQHLWNEDLARRPAR